MDAHDAFERLVADLDYPMFVVSAAAGDERDACLVGFTSQCSIDPPRFGVFLSVENRTYEIARRAQHLIVHLLRHGDEAFAEHFGGVSGDEIDKLAGIAWHEGLGGAPVIEGLDWFAGRIRDRLDTGDHVLHVLEVVDGECTHGGEAQLGFQQARGIEPGNPA